MDNFDSSETTPDSKQQNDTPQEPEVELSHSDKMIGIFTEPGKTFESIAQHPAKTIDWFLPFLLLLVITAICHFVLMNNPEIKYSVTQKAIAQAQKRLDAEVKAGHITQEQANEQIDRIQQFMGGSSFQLIISIVGIFVGGFIIFFIMAGIYYLFARFALRGEGNYVSVLVPYGLVSYITIIQIVIATILAFLLNRYFLDISLASILDSDKSTIMGFILDKLNVINIWMFIVFGIGLAKMFKSKNTAKYVITVLCIWIFGTLILFYIGKAVPFLNFGR